MLSSELAELAGVTVRTLRHYHQIGLLPEPRRSSAGYRHYDVAHLVRLLRITRMAALGIPLSTLPTMLDDPTTAEDVLDELDRQAVAEIDLLTARRASIAALRRAGAPPDLPPELSPWHSDPTGRTSAELARYENDQLILLGHLLGQDGPTRLAALLDDAGAEGAGSETLMERFNALQPDTPKREVSALVRDMIDHLEPMMDRPDDSTWLDPQASALMGQLRVQRLHGVQQLVLTEVEQGLRRPEQS